MKLRLVWLPLALAVLGCGGDLDSDLAEARDLQEVGAFGASIDALEAVLARDPDHPEANYRLGAALVQTGEPSRALWPLEKASASDEYALSAGVLLASTHFRTRNYDEAIRAASRVLEIDSERPAALRIRANALLAARRLAEALEDSKRLVALFPDDYSVRAMHAAVLGELGRLEEAEREHAVLKRLGDSSEDPALRDRACLAPAIFALEVKEEAEEARSLFEECAERGPADLVAVQRLAGFFDSVGETERSTALWRGAADHAPDDLALRQGLARRLEALGESEQALQVLRESVEHFDSAAAWQGVANYHRMRGEAEPALAALDRVIERSSGDEDRARFVQADLLIDLGDLERAARVTESLEHETYAHLLRGRIALVQGEPEQALAHFDHGIRAWPNNASARFLAGLAARDLGDTERAISELREAVRAGNAETEAALELARLYLDSGESQQAITFANMALRGRNGALRPEPYVIAVRALAQQGEAGRANAPIARLEQLGFGVVALSERIWLAMATSGPEAAIQTALESGADLSAPEQRPVLRSLVEAELAVGRPEQSVPRVEAALERSPDDSSLHALSGSVKAAAGDREAARAAFDRALELDADSPYAHAGLADLHRQAGELEQALAGFDRAYALLPERAYAYAAAQLLIGAGRDAEAETRLRGIVRRHPGAGGARNDLAWMLAERGEELDLALSLVKGAVGRAPEASVHDTLGWVHLRRGEVDLAVESLERAVAAAPESASIRYRLGVALGRQGETQRARSMLEQALAAGPFPEAEQARQQLAALAP